MSDIASGRLYDLPALGAEELFTDLVRAPGVRIERIVSRGQVTPVGTWLEQAQAEFVVLLSGAARLVFEDPARTVEMKPGDWIDIPPDCRHRVDWTDERQPCVWLAVHRGT